jgi:hypothetical protein
MPVSKVSCPECGAVLKSSKPVTPGKKIRCPKCGESFTAPSEEVQEARPRPATKASPAARKKTAAPPPAPAKHTDDDDDDIGGTYAVIKEPEDHRRDDDEDDDDDDRDKPDLTFALDLSVKDPRGQAQMRIVRPSNWLILSGAIGCLIQLFWIGWAAFPFIFNEGEWLSDAEVAQALGKTYKEGTAPPHIERKDMKGDDEAKVEAMELIFLIFHIFVGSFAFVYLLLAGLVVYGGVKMQNMESWGWGLAASIIALFGTATGIFGVLFGVWCLVTLNDPKVKEGFRYQQEHKDDV